MLAHVKIVHQTKINNKTNMQFTKLVSKEQIEESLVWLKNNNVFYNDRSINMSECSAIDKNQCTTSSHLESNYNNDYFEVCFI